MSGSRKGWRAVVQATVQSDGKVEALGHQYWGPSMVKYAGWQVEVRVFDDGGPVQVWSGHYFLCSADVIADTGFEDAEAARKWADRVKAIRKAASHKSRQDRVFDTLGLLNFADEDDRKANGCPAIHRTGDPDRDRVAQASGANPLALSRTLARCGASMRRIAQARRSRSTQGQKLQEQNRKPNRRSSSSVSKNCSAGTKRKAKPGMAHCLSGLAILTVMIAAMAWGRSK